MFKCNKCGHVFDEGEQGRYTENHGVVWGLPAIETFACCPECNSDDFEEAVKCETCGEWFTEDELFYGVCESCKEKLISDYRFKPKACYNLAKEESTTVEINSFLASMFTAEQINGVLLDALTELEEYGYLLSDCEPFIKSDLAWFIEKAKGVNK